jgi:hypothetical protein
VSATSGGITSTKANAGTTFAFVANNSTAGGNVFSQYQIGGVAKGSYGWQTGIGMILYDHVTNATWLSQGTGAAGYVKTANNVLDDGTGIMTLNGTAGLSQIYFVDSNGYGSVRHNSVGTSVFDGTSGASITMNKDGSGVPIYPGILLPTTGGTATLFNNYEEFNYVTPWSGPFTTTASLTHKITRSGRVVTLQIAAFNSAGISASSTIVCTTAMPTRFCPPTQIWKQDVTADINSFSGTTAVGCCIVGTTGVIRFGLSPNSSYPSTTNNLGIYGYTICWSV